MDEMKAKMADMCVCMEGMKAQAGTMRDDMDAMQKAIAEIMAHMPMPAKAVEDDGDPVLRLHLDADAPVDEVVATVTDEPVPEADPLVSYDHDELVAVLTQAMRANVRDLVIASVGPAIQRAVDTARGRVW